MRGDGRAVVVWGNCQAAPLSALLTPALTAAGCEVVAVPPVFEATEADVARVHELLRGAAALISQPVREEYQVPGCGTRELAGLLPEDARLVTFPVTFDSTAFPYQVNAHGGDGARVPAPLTDYHDLRLLWAAEQGWSAGRTVQEWPRPPAEAVRISAAASLAELRRREADLDVVVSDLLTPGGLFTLDHPSNAVLAPLAARVLTTLGLPGVEVAAPEREFLGERRAPIEPAVVDALGWPEDTVRERWVVRGEPLDTLDLVGAQLDFYAGRPDVVADSRVRHADRRAALGLDG